MSIRSNRKKEEGRRAQSGISRMGDGNVSRRYNASEEEISRDYQKCAGGGLPHVAVLLRLRMERRKQKTAIL